MLPATPTRRGLWNALAGLQAGMVGALLLLAWLALASLFYRRSPWAFFNLFATTFYGEPALGPLFGWKSLAGAAFVLIIYSLFGAAFGIAVQGHIRPEARFRLLLIGVLSAIAWYYLTFGFIWRHVSPLLILYLPDRPMFLGHLLYGAWIGRTPAYLPVEGHPE